MVVLAQELLVDFEDVDDSGEGGPQVGLEDVLVGEYHRLATLETDYIDRMVLFYLFKFLDGGAQDLRRLEVIHLQEVLLQLLPEVGIGDQVSDAVQVVRAVADGGIDEVPFDRFAVGRDIRPLILGLVGLKDLLLAQKEPKVQVDRLILLVLTQVLVDELVPLVVLDYGLVAQVCQFQLLRDLTDFDVVLLDLGVI